MSRLIFEDDDVIREALMMDSDVNDDSNLIDRRPISSKASTNEYKVQKSENQNVLKVNVDGELTNKEMEEKHNSETKYQCQNCLQEFEKKELQNHDCGKKKRKSLVLSFHRNLSITSSLNLKSSRKSNINNDTAKSDKRKSIDLSTSEKIGKNNHKKSSEYEKNCDLEVKEQNVVVKKSKTPIFYECPACFQHFTKKEFDIHNCRDNSPCLTLKFPTRCSFNDSVDKYDSNKSKRAKMSVKSKDFLKTDVKTFTHKEKAQAKHKRDNNMSFPTDLKQPIESQHPESEKNLKKYNQPIALKNDTKKTKIMKRKSPDMDKGTEKKVYEPKTKNIKLDNQNNVKNQSVNTISEGSIGYVNRIVAIETSSQKATTKKKYQPNDEKDTSKNKNSYHSETVDPKSIPHIENNTILRNGKSDVLPNQVGPSSNKKPINKIEKRKSFEKSCNNVLHEIDTELKQTVLNKRILRSAKQIVNLQSVEEKQIKKSDKLPKQGEVSSQITDKMSKMDEKSSKIVNKNVVSEKRKICRMIKQKVQLEKEQEGTDCQNLKNKILEVVSLQKKQDGGTKIETSNNQKEDLADKISKKGKSKVILQKEGTENRNLVNKNAEAVTKRNEIDDEEENSNKHKETKQIVIKSRFDERKKGENSDKLLKQGEMSSQTTDKISKNDVISEGAHCLNLVNKEGEVVTIRNEHDGIADNENPNNQKEAEGNRNIENVGADLTQNEKKNSTEQEKSIKTEFSQEDNLETLIIKKTKRYGLQIKYKCRLCYAKYTKIKHHNHICKNKNKKTKSKKNKRQIVKKSDAILKNYKNNSQSKINITILSSENVKVVTVSNNAKDYEVNQGDISNYVHSDIISKQKEIKQITEQIHKSATETVSQSELCNISEDKAFEKEKMTFDVTEKAEQIISQHKNADGQNSDIIISKEFSICEENSKIQENDESRVETQKQNKNEKDDGKLVTKNLRNNSNPTEIENAILSQNSDHSYIITDVENNLSINTVNSEHTVSTRDVEHNYSVTEENMISTYKIDSMISKTVENGTIVTENERVTNRTETNSTKNKENETITTENLITNSENKEIEINLNENQISTSKNREKETIRTKTKITSTEYKRTTTKFEEKRISETTNIQSEITTSESEMTSLENIEREVTIPEGEESETTELERKITIPECEITLTENVESDVTIPESTKSEITIRESLFTEPENLRSHITVTTQNENTISTQNINIENFTNQIGSTDCEIVISNDNVENEVIIAAQIEGIDNNELTLKDNIVSIDDVAQEIIIPALEEEITYEESEIVSADAENYVSITTPDSLVSIENVAQEVIITNENIETDDVSIENVGNLIIITERDENVVVIQNEDNNVESTGRRRTVSMKDVEHTITDENLGNEIITFATGQIKDNIKQPYTDLINKKQHYINRESYTKTSAENIDHHIRNEEIEKVSVESLENEVFVLNYVGKKDSIKGVQIEANVSTTNVKASESIEDIQINETYISKQDDASVSTRTKTNGSTKNVKAHNEIDVSTKNVAPSGTISDTNISTQNNVLVENMINTIVKAVTEVNQDQPTAKIDNENNILVLNELTTSAKKEERILSSQSGQSEKNAPTNDEIETIIIISSEDDNRKNIVLTQNEKNETVIIISKQKEEMSGDNSTVPSRIEERTNLDGNNKLSLTEHEDIAPKNYHKCSKTFTRDELKTHNCTEGREKIKKGKIMEFKFRNEKKLHKKGNNHKCGENIGVKEKEDSSSTGTEIAAILNQTDSQNKILETQERFSGSPGNHKCDKNNKDKEDITLESQLAAILNQNESQNKMEVKQDHSRSYSVNNIRNDDLTDEGNRSSITKNQLLDILSKNVDDTSQVQNFIKINHETAQKENSTKTKCFRCSKEFTDRELMTHNCLKKSRETDQNSDKIENIMTQVAESRQNNDAAEKNVLYVIEIKENSEAEEKLCTDHKVPNTKCIKCFICSEIYDKTHKCSSNEKETENNNITLEKPDINSQDESQPKDTKFKKKNKYYFDKYILTTKHGAYQCKICKKEYTARKNLVRHIHKHEKDYDKERFKCSLCPKKFQYKASLKSHEACHTGETYACSICNKSFSRKTNLYTHLKLHRDEKFPCDKCGKVYASKQYLKNHPCFNTKEYSCYICYKKYRQKSNLIDHLHTHAGLKPYKCEFCNKKFAFKSTYLIHKQNCAVGKQQENHEKHNKNNQLSCKFCSITLKNKSQLQQHEWRHENKHFFCNICSKKFNSKHYLQLHLASHDESGVIRKKFDCPHCEKNFATKFGLKLHLNIHNGVTFPCPLCEKLFTTKLLLKTHEKTHTGQTPFVCENCKKAFNNRSNYNRHKNNKVCLFTPIETLKDE